MDLNVARREIRMLEANLLLLHRNEFTRQLLKWAVLCASTLGCIDPPGNFHSTRPNNFHFKARQYFATLIGKMRAGSATVKIRVCSVSYLIIWNTPSNNTGFQHFQATMPLILATLKVDTYVVEVRLQLDIISTAVNHNKLLSNFLELAGSQRPMWSKHERLAFLTDVSGSLPTLSRIG